MKIGFYSCMSGVPWGGSEELWCRAARRLQDQGHQVCVNYKWWPDMARPLRDLRDRGAEIWLRQAPLSPWRRRLAWLLRQDPGSNGSHRPWLMTHRPDAVLITLGYHPDRVDVATDCVHCGIPYAINVQCASHFFFIHSDNLDKYRQWYHNAERVYFVSQENQEKLETNLATRLSNAEIIDNPYNIDCADLPPWPSTDEGYRLACVGRIHFQSKAQDLIVDVLRQPKWRARPLTVGFYGKDQGNQRQLQELIRLHGLEPKLRIEGFREYVNQIWAENHALLLPSRYEGAPLCVVEAMMCARMCVATDTGRNRQLMDDGASGFIIPGATAELLDVAMERAWNQRAHWRTMGELAAQHIRLRHHTDPPGDLARRLTQLAKGA